MNLEQRGSCGHFFDPGRHTVCPYCPVNGLDVRTTHQVPADRRTAAQLSQTRPQAVWPVDGADPITQPIVKADLGIDPVVGWLVCVEGPNRGRDYRIRSENNPIGRSEEMHISIAGDDTIARIRHASITFEPRQATFHLVPGDARGLVYLNGEPVLSARPLRPHDEIALGRTTLRFVPLCGESFQWKQVD